MREVVGDCETTGLSWREGDRVVSLGLVELIDGLPTGRQAHWYCNPCGRRSSRGAYDTHGLGEQFLSIQQHFEEHAPEIVEFLGRDPFVAHNAGFDIGFINREMELARRPQDVIEPGRVIDTLAMARKKFPGGKNGLAALAVRFQIDITGRRLHNALADAVLLAEVYRQLKTGPQGQLALGEVPGHRPIPSLAPAAPARPANRCRITDAERAAHADFVRSLGESAIWLDYLEPENVSEAQGERPRGKRRQRRPDGSDGTAKAG